MHKKQINALSFDIEDWYHICGTDSVLPIERWKEYESRVEINTQKLLSILDEYNTKATFFMLGWIAENYPSLTKNIFEKGHELATHGYDHSLVYNQTPKQFKKGLQKAINSIEKITGTAVIGYRAPSFSIKQDCVWAFDILTECGLKYDSSVFPTLRGQGGMTSGEYKQTYIYEINTNNGNLIEFPMSVVKTLIKNIPICGGGYFRIFPYSITNWGIKKYNLKEKQPVIFYLHPRDIDPEQPRLQLPFYRRFKSYTGLKGCEKKLRKLLDNHSFAPVKNVLQMQGFDMDKQ